MHDDVDPDLLLQVDDALDLVTHETQVFGFADQALRELCACTTDVAGLRERPDRGRGQERQAKGLLLRGETVAVVPAGEVGLGEGGRAGADGRVANARRRLAVREGSGCGTQRILHRLVPVDQACRKRRDLPDLLVREREP